MTTLDHKGSTRYVPRLVDRLLPDAVAGLPAVSLIGPRGAGKTTTARQYSASLTHLNRPAEAGVFRADPDAAIGRLATPALLDEWQEVPEILGAVKRAVDADPRAGRFILTGSVRAQVETDTWQGTGRVTRIPVYAMTQREIAGKAQGDLFVDRLLAADAELLQPAPDSPDIFGYLAMALRGGFPDAALNRDGVARDLWLAGYLDELLTRDAKLTGTAPDAHRFSAYVEALALMSAGVVEDKTLFDAAHVGRATAAAYEQVLTALFMIEQVPAWWSNRLTRLVALPKRYITDTSLMATALRLDLDGIARDSNLLGRLIDTFVAMQIRPELAVSPRRPRLFHIRDKGGRHEVDLVIEYGGGLVVGIEVKATAAPDASDAMHLAWLRDNLGDRFAAGVVLHTGPHTFPLGDQITAAPISTLWA